MLTETEKIQLKRLSELYRNSGGNPEDPFDEVTIQINRGEMPNPEIISAAEISTLRELFAKEAGLIID